MALTLGGSARLAGGHRWWEVRLFEVLGGWVASTGDVDAKLLLDRHSQHHAWRASQWWDRLPVLADVDRDALVVAPEPAVEKMMGELASLADVVERLAGAYRVALPRLVGRYQGHRELTSPTGDGATIRTLDLVEPDVARDWRDGELLLQRLLTDAGAVQRAAATAGRLEEMLSLHSAG
jgi:hypothetical protein